MTDPQEEVLSSIRVADSMHRRNPATKTEDAAEVTERETLPKTRTRKIVSTRTRTDSKEESRLRAKPPR